MKDIRNTNVRFNLKNPQHQKAWSYLQTMDRKVFKSYSAVIATALVYFFDRYYRQRDDPYLETRESEELFVNRIVEEVGRNIRSYFPTLIKNTAYSSDSNIIQAEENEKDVNIDWSFIGKG